MGSAFLVPAIAAAVACGSSSNSSPPADAGSTACSDSLANIFAKSQCPADSNGKPSAWEQAITSTCSSQGLSTGQILYGQCLDFLVWEQDNDTSGSSFSKCFYDTTSHALVGILFSDGMQDQCGGKSLTIQAGAGTDARCIISGLTSGGGGNVQSCGHVPEAGSDAASE
jgi:hypothetical protein